MKYILITLVSIIVLGIAGYFGYQYLLQSSGESQFQSVNTTSEQPAKTTTVEGMLIKVPNPKDDYTHTLKTVDKLVRVASYTVSLDDYNNKNVAITGQYSGTTLFADSISEK